MHGLNNLINNNVRHQRLDDINKNDNINNNVQQHQHYNLINIHHITSTYTFHIIVHQHIYIPSCNISSIMLFITKQGHLELITSPKAFKYALKANSKQKCMNTTQEHEKGRTLLGYSPWRAILLAVASKHCSLLHNYLPWRVGIEQTLLSVTPSSPWGAVYSRWRT